MFVIKRNENLNIKEYKKRCVYRLCPDTAYIFVKLSTKYSKTEIQKRVCIFSKDIAYNSNI